MRAAMMVSKSLHEGGTEPSLKRSAAGVRGQRRSAFTLDAAKSVELGIEGVGKILAQCGRPGDRCCAPDKKRPIAAQESLPCRVAPKCAGMRKCKFDEMKRAEVCGFLQQIGCIAGREAVIHLLADRSEYGAKFAHTEPAA